MAGHLRLIVDNSGRRRWVEKGRIDPHSPRLAFTENSEPMSLRDRVVDAPMRYGGFTDTPTQSPDSLSAPKGNDQVCNVINSRIIHHEPGYSPNDLDMSNVLSLGPTFYRNRAILPSMRDMIKDVDSISARIVLLRKQRDWKPKDAYESCGIGKTTWNNYEKGVSRPSLDHAAAICEVFGVTLDWLYTGNTAGLSQATHAHLYEKTA